MGILPQKFQFGNVNAETLISVFASSQSYVLNKNITHFTTKSLEYYFHFFPKSNKEIACHLKRVPKQYLEQLFFKEENADLFPLDLAVISQLPINFNFVSGTIRCRLFIYLFLNVCTSNLSTLLTLLISKIVLDSFCPPPGSESYIPNPPDKCYHQD